MGILLRLFIEPAGHLRQLAGEALEAGLLLQGVGQRRAGGAGVQCQRRLAFFLAARIVAVEWPEAGGGQLLHLLVALGQIVAVLLAGAVGDDEGGARVGLRLLNCLHRLVHLGAEGDLRHVDVTVHHHVGTEILAPLALALLAKLGDGAERGGLGLLAAGVGVALGVEHQHIDVLPQAQHVIQPAVTDVVGPAVAADEPDRFLHQVVRITGQLPGRCVAAPLQ